MLSKNSLKHYRVHCFGMLLGLFASHAAYAYSQLPNLGQAAQNILGPIGLLTEGLYKLFYIIGGAMIVGAFIQYLNHRKNPTVVRLSTPILLLTVGIALVLLPIISSYSSSVPSSVAAY